jgi:hypothetical protein
MDRREEAQHPTPFRSTEVPNVAARYAESLDRGEKPGDRRIENYGVNIMKEESNFHRSVSAARSHVRSLFPWLINMFDSFISLF